MPNLPTFNVTAAQAERLTAAFGSVANYKAWLKVQIIAYVKAAERAAINAEIEAERAARHEAVPDMALDDVIEEPT